MIRVLNGKTRGDHTNMKKLREELKIMSVNELSVYHAGMEMFNIINNASDFISLILVSPFYFYVKRKGNCWLFGAITWLFTEK